MEKNQKSSRSEGECKPSQACLLHIVERKKSKSLDHGLLLMLFFSCKRNKIEQKSLFMFLHLCDSIYILNV